jgi:uncharacterized protein YdhG (YjbR/CyaY superfamily)
VTTETSASPEIQAYFAGIPDDQRRALLALREIIRHAAPEVVEVVSYGIPTFKLHGSLVALGSAKKHCALYHMSGNLQERLGDDLEGYDTSKGTIRFTPETPLPADLVERIVRARIEENLEIIADRERRKREKKSTRKA